MCALRREKPVSHQKRKAQTADGKPIHCACGNSAQVAPLHRVTIYTMNGFAVGGLRFWYETGLSSAGDKR